MAREEHVAELVVGTVSFKLEASPAPKEEMPEVEELEPIEAIAQQMEGDLGVQIDRHALEEFLGKVPQRKGRS